jgi:hypothetical protein
MIGPFFQASRYQSPPELNTSPKTKTAGKEPCAFLAPAARDLLDTVRRPRGSNAYEILFLFTIGR